MRYIINTLGCKVNQYETQAMETLLRERGHEPAGEGESAELVIVNSCAVTAESGRKSRQALRRLMEHYPGAASAVCGCWAQVEPDAAEALGTKYTEGELAGKFAGTMGDVGVYSFNGNKIITTGSGGVVVSNHPEWAARAKHLSTQSKTDLLQFKHDEVGYNYRMTNIDACLGLAQMELLEGFIEHKTARYEQYKAALDGVKGFSMLPFREGTRSNHWFYSLLLPDRLERDDVIARLQAQGIQTRPVWSLIPEQCDYSRNETHAMDVAREYRRRIVNIPCSTNLTEAQCSRVIEAILAL